MHAILNPLPMKQAIFSALAALSLLLPGSVSLQAQGCSDAGVCTISAFQPKSPDAAPLSNNVRIGAGFGVADYEIGVLSSMLEYQRRWSPRFSTDLRLTHLSHFERFFGPVHGPGDVFVTGNVQASDRLSASLGLKIPLANGDRRDGNGATMPMDLQSSLGTLDLIAGMGYRIGRLELFLAWQQPLTQNDNSFLSPCEEAPADLCDPVYPSTQGFRRAGDLMLRAALPWQPGTRWTFTPGLLGIYHLANDSYLNRFGLRRDFEGSQGLTLNVNLFIEYAFSDRDKLQLQLGAPAVVRESRPDGLTRALVSGLQYHRQF